MYLDSSGGDQKEGINVQVRDRNHIIRGDGSLYDRQVFYNGITFKEAILDYALRT